jgi:hypothetical protein
MFYNTAKLRVVILNVFQDGKTSREEAIVALKRATGVAN